ncbi:MAG: flagellar hook basal-body protein [Gemmatimonadaceae bacterium]
MKTDGIASAAHALRYWERRQEVASNNLANVNTAGFKGERIFARLMGEGVPTADSATDFREGTYSPTGNALDLAIRGDAYFVVNTPAGERWTRGGAWSVDTEGFLVDSEGNRALGEKGPIHVAGTEVAIDRTGLVIVDEMKIDRLRIEAPASGAVLQHEAGTRFVPDSGRTSVALDAREVRQGEIEGSNVNTISSLVDLISIQRNYANAQKVLTTLDGIRGTITNELGKVPG